MARISNETHLKINDLVKGLHAVVKKLRPTHPLLADVYAAFAKTIDGSHYSSKKDVFLELPGSCRLVILLKGMTTLDGPLFMEIVRRDG